MRKPTLHLNGTSRAELIRLNNEAFQALDEAIRAMTKACPNGRDFYVQGPDAIGEAMDEHYARLAKVTAAREELAAILEHLVTGERKPR